jgi:hypothetical protein
MPLWVNRTVLSGSSVDENGTTKHTCTFTTATQGNYLVAVVAGAVTFTTPAGWTLIDSAISNAAIYLFVKTAAGGESSFETTHNASNFLIKGVVYEFMAGTTIIGSANDNSQAYNSGETGPQVSSLTGTYSRFSARCLNLENSNSTFSTAWTLPTVEDYDSGSPFDSNDGVGLTIAYDDGSTGASFDPSSNISSSNNSNPNGQGIAFALSIKTTRETPIAEYSFDTIGTPGTSLAVSGTIPDLSGNGNTLVVQNTAMDIVDGHVRGRGVKGDGSTRAHVASSSAIKPTSAVTWMCWMRRTNTFNWGVIIGRCNDDTGWGDAFSFYCDESNNTGIVATIQLDNAGTAAQTQRDMGSVAAYALPLNEWTHFASTWSAATHLLKTFKNGVEIDSVATSNDNAIFYGSGGNTSKLFNIFFNQQFSEIGNNIEIDDVKVYDVALSPGEIRYAMDTPPGNSVGGGVWFVA